MLSLTQWADRVGTKQSRHRKIGATSGDRAGPSCQRHGGRFLFGFLSPLCICRPTGPTDDAREALDKHTRRYF